jgi:hypothetical protein
MVGVPVRAIAERTVAEHMRRYGAVSPDRAMGYAPIRWSHARALVRLRDLGIVKGADNALWLDEPAWDDRRGSRRKRALGLLVVGAAGAGLAALLG